MTKQEFLRELWNRLSELPQEDVEKSLDYYSEMIDDRVENGLSEEEAIADIGPAEKVAAQLIEELPEEIKERSVSSARIIETEKKPEAAAQNTNNTGTAQSTVNTTQSTANTAQSTANAAHSTAGSYSSQSVGGGYSSYTPQSYYEATAQKKSSGAGKFILLLCTFPIWFPILISVGAVIFALFVSVWAVTFSLFAVAASFLVAGVAGLVLLFILTVQGEFALGLVYVGVGFLLAGLGLIFMVFSGSIVKGVALLSAKIWRGLTSLFRRRRTA